MRNEDMTHRSTRIRQASGATFSPAGLIEFKRGE